MENTQGKDEHRRLCGEAAALSSAAAASSAAVAAAAVPAVPAAAAPPLVVASAVAAVSASAACSSLPACDTLVLGMAYVNEEYGQQRHAHVATSIAVVRDRARLTALERAGHKIISLNHTHSAAQCHPNRHLHACFDRRAAKELAETFGKGKPGWVLSHIFCDYFRFPTQYMRGAYGSFLSSMLPALISGGLMTHASELVLPNLRGLCASLEGKQFQRPNSPDSPLQPCFLDFLPLLAKQYALFTSTSGVPSEELGGYSNSGELKQLHPTHPFVRIRLTDCMPASQRSFDLTFRSKLLPNVQVEPVDAQVQIPPQWLLHASVTLTPKGMAGRMAQKQAEAAAAADAAAEAAALIVAAAAAPSSLDDAVSETDRSVSPLSSHSSDAPASACASSARVTRRTTAMPLISAPDPSVTEVPQAKRRRLK
jgi:hypothetical protein